MLTNFRRLQTVLLIFSILLATSPSRADFTFIHTTDTHIGAGDNVNLDAAMYRELRTLAPRPAFIVNTGDVTESGLEREFAAYKKVRDENLGTEIPVYDTPGNHDARWNPLGKEGFTRGLGEPLWRSWDRENVHFVALDSTVLLQHWGHFDQEELDWLAKDLAKNGRERPVVLGFHHFFLRDTRGGPQQVDNYAALLKVIAPYNVRLFLIGHGHSDIQWSINGIPAIMAKGLYQGSYHQIAVTGETMRVQRRTVASESAPQTVLTIPLDQQTAAAPSWRAQVRLSGSEGTVTVEPGKLPAQTTFAFSAGGNVTPLTRGPDGGYRGTFKTDRWMAGSYTGLVSATLPTAVAGLTPIYARAIPLTVVTAPGGKNTPIWTRVLPSAIQSRLVRAGGLVYVPTMGGSLYALDSATGRTRWQFKTGGALFSVPLVDSGTVYVGSGDHFIYALDAITGKLRWKRETGGSVLAGAARAGEVVCIASTDRKIYGLEAATGTVRWTQGVESLYQSAAITDGTRFYLGGWDNKFRCLDARTGTPIWTNTFGRSFYYSPAIGSPTLGDGRVFVTSNDGLLHAMDAVTGRVLWETKPMNLGYSGPLLQGGTLYNASLTGGGIVRAFDAATGTQKWETPTGSVIYDSSCVASGGTVFVGCVNGTFSALRQSDGALLWQYQLGPGHLLASPAADDERVYIANMDGTVAAFSAVAP
ncbi:MAG: PQQ-binding-like beta-propeller repeat protein [Cytophagales bacterium]|nr:PQQ-binding-like beta-propeller repeat protein [Armatimonadota bacterium]